MFHISFFLDYSNIIHILEHSTGIIKNVVNNITVRVKEMLVQLFSQA